MYPNAVTHMSQVTLVHVTCITNWLCVDTHVLPLSAAVGKVSKFETPELKSDLEKAAKTAEDEAEVRTFPSTPLCFLHCYVNAALTVSGSHIPAQLMQIKHVLVTPFHLTAIDNC